MNAVSYNNLFEPMLAKLTAFQHLIWLAMCVGLLTYIAEKIYAAHNGYTKKESRVFAGIVAKVPYILVIMIGIKFIIPWGGN